MKFIIALLITLAISIHALAGPAVKLATDTSMGANFNSSAYAIQDAQKLSIQMVMTASSSQAGTIKPQASNIEHPKADADWVDIDGSSQSVTTSSTHMWNIVDPAYQHIRAVYTRTGGSATANIYLNAVGK